MPLILLLLQQINFNRRSERVLCWLIHAQNGLFAPWTWFFVFIRIVCSVAAVDCTKLNLISFHGLKIGSVCRSVYVSVSVSESGRSVITCWFCRHDDGNDDGWTFKTNPNSHGCLSVSVSVLQIWPNPEKVRGPFDGGWSQYFSGKLSTTTSATV